MFEKIGLNDIAPQNKNTEIENTYYTLFFGSGVKMLHTNLPHAKLKKEKM